MESIKLDGCEEVANSDAVKVDGPSKTFDVK